MELVLSAASLVSFVALIGAENEITLDDSALETRLARLNRLPQEAGEYVLRSPATFRKHFNGRWTVRDASRLNTDEHPRVEFLAPITHRDNQILVQAALRAYNARVLSKLPKTGLRDVGR